MCYDVRMEVNRDFEIDRISTTKKTLSSSSAKKKLEKFRSIYNTHSYQKISNLASATSVLNFIFKYNFDFNTKFR